MGASVVVLIVCVCVRTADAVDNGQNKKAVQIADKILKKQGDLQCAKVCVQLGRGLFRGAWEVVLLGVGFIWRFTSLSHCV